VEGKLLAPHFVGRATGLHPLAVLLALLAGAQMAGLIGALVAVPLAAGLWEIVRVLYVEPRRLA
jgi:putative heme transporter